MPDVETLYDVCATDFIPPGQGVSFRLGTVEMAVFLSREGRFFAIENRCPHRQGPLSEGIVGGGKVVCPLHSHKFDLQTGEGSEKPECVKSFPLEIKGGRILVAVRE